MMERKAEMVGDIPVWFIVDGSCEGCMFKKISNVQPIHDGLCFYSKGRRPYWTFRAS